MPQMRGLHIELKSRLEDERKRVELFSIIFLAFVAFFFSFGFMWADRMSDGGGVIDADGRINPNTAVVSSLVRLPGIGTSKAFSIVSYREEFSGRDLAFARGADLQNVNGIGPKTVENIGKFLKFD